MRKMTVRVVATALLALAALGLSSPAQANPVPNPKDAIYKITHVCQYAYCRF